MLDGYERFEGDSDPGDSSILFLLTGEDGNKGYLVAAYGMHGDVDLFEFMKKIK